MAKIPVSVSAPWPTGTPIPGSDGDWPELSPGLDDGAELMPDWSDGPEPSVPSDLGTRPTRAPGHRA